MSLTAEEHSTGVSHGTDAPFEPSGVDRVYDSVRRDFGDFIRVTFEETGISSRKETEQLRSWLDEIAGDEEKVREARESFHRYSRGIMEETRKLYYESFIKPLDEALESGAISGKSYQKWLDWVHDEERGSTEKKRSIRDVLPAYLKERHALALERARILKDPRLNTVTEGKLKAEISFLRDDREYFEKLSFTQRKNLVDRVVAGLKVTEGGEEYQKLRVQAEEMLIGATRVPQPALHRDKVGTWLRRIFESGAKPEEMRAFLEESGEGSLKKLIDTWRSVAIQFWTLRKDEAFKGVQTSFIDTKAFLWKHFDERVSYVSSMRSEAERARNLRARARARISQSSEALDEAGRQRWLEQYVFNGKFTLAELESIIATDLSSRLDRKVAVVQRFEQAFAKARKTKGIRGMPFPEKSAFLKLHYEKQLSFVREMEMRLEQIKRQKPDFLLIRHFMDREDFEAALDLIAEARKKPGITLEDDAQLTSMEGYIALHSSHSSALRGASGSSTSVRAGSRTSGRDAEASRGKLIETEKIDHLIDSMSPELQRLCIILCGRGSESIGALGWTSYNRDWCHKHGYLNPEREHHAIREGKQQALEKARRRRRGVINENIQGETAEEEFIELSRSSATNVCLDLSDSSAVNAYAETLYHRRKDHRALYWTNAIFHHGGLLMELGSQREETRKIYQMRNLLRKLEAQGQHYHYRGTAMDIAQTTAKTRVFRSAGNAGGVSQTSKMNH